MNRAEGTLEQAASNSRDENFQAMASIILETMAAFGKPYGPNYTAQFLTGDKYLALRQAAHQDIETRGRLGFRSVEDVLRMLHHLVDLGLIEGKAPDCMTIDLSQAGRQWLTQRDEITADIRQMRFSPQEKYLRNALKVWRRDLAERMKVKVWETIADFSLDRIVLAKPLDMDALVRIPGMNPLKTRQFGLEILKCVQDVSEHFEDFMRASLLAKVKGGSYPKVKALFDQNLTLPEIAEQCRLNLNTVHGYLRDLHTANLVDLIPWIERNINSKSLSRGVKHFEQMPNSTIKEAFQTLGLDYSTLLFCALYAKDKRMHEKESRKLAS